MEAQLLEPSFTSQTDADPVSRPERIVYPDNPRYQRIRFLSLLMDHSLPLPYGYRIGADAFLGLLPGVGDALGALVSFYLIYQSARLGVRKRTILRMIGNVLIDAVGGSVPLLGDIFDAAWKANLRNLQLLEAEYHPMLPERSAGRVLFALIGAAGLVLLIISSVFYVAAKVLLGVLAAVVAFFRP